MKTFNTDSNNDLFLKRNSIDMANDIYAVSRSCKQAIKTVLGELELNADVGMPYHEQVWVGSPNIRQIEQSMREVILTVDNVHSISSLSAFVKDNELSYTAVINTSFGAVQLGL